MKRIAFVLLAALLVVGCSKETESDQLANTTWESQDSRAAMSHGAIYYNDGSACTELWEFTDYGCVWRHITYNGEKVELMGCPGYTLTDSTLVIENDSTHTYVLRGNVIVGRYLSNGKEYGTFTQIK